jgi:DUF1680 family protein
LRRGPLVYCFESVENGENLSALTLDLASGFEALPAPELPAGTLQIRAKGFRRTQPNGEFVPYTVARAAASDEQPIELVAVPYHLWGNRGAGEMTVWMRRHRG